MRPTWPDGNGRAGQRPTVTDVRTRRAGQDQRLPGGRPPGRGGQCTFPRGPGYPCRGCDKGPRRPAGGSQRRSDLARSHPGRGHRHRMPNRAGHKRPRRRSTVAGARVTVAGWQGRRAECSMTGRYAETSSTTPALTAQITICCLVLNPSFFCTPETAFRTVNALLFLISPIS